MTKPRAKPVATKAAAAPIVSSRPLTVLTTAPGSLGPFGYTAGVLIDEVPQDVAKTNAGWMDSDPANVEAARSAGTPAVPYRG